MFHRSVCHELYRFNLKPSEVSFVSSCASKICMCLELAEKKGVLWGEIKLLRALSSPSKIFINNFCLHIPTLKSWPKGI